MSRVPRAHFNFYRPEVVDMSYQKIQKMIEDNPDLGGSADVIKLVVQKLGESGINIGTPDTVETLVGAIADKYEPKKVKAEKRDAKIMNTFIGWAGNYPKTAMSAGLVVLAVGGIIGYATWNAFGTLTVYEGIMEYIQKTHVGVLDTEGYAWLQTNLEQLKTVVWDAPSNAKRLLEVLKGFFTAFASYRFSDLKTMPGPTPTPTPTPTLTSAGPCGTATAYTYFYIAITNALTILGVGDFGGNIVKSLSSFAGWVYTGVNTSLKNSVSCVKSGAQTLSAFFVRDDVAGDAVSSGMDDTEGWAALSSLLGTFLKWEEINLGGSTK